MTQGQGEILWRPSAEQVNDAKLTGFARYVEDRHGAHDVSGDYFALHRWSVDHLDLFWQAVADYFEVEFTQAPRQVIDDSGMPGAKWFEGAEVSYAAHVFRDRDPAAVAIVEAGELRPTRSITWGELHDTTARVAAYLRGAGVVPGDRVAGYMPNIAETVAAFLACSSLGAIWSSCSPDFGERAVIDRLAQIEPKVLFTVDGYRYGGRDFSRLPVITALRKAMPALERTVLLPYLDAGIGSAALGSGEVHTWEELTSGDPGELTFASLPFDHPLWVLYSSGTTGLPKGLIHSQGGILLEHLKWVALQTDLKADDRLFWMTTTGWTMWNFLVGGLLSGAGIVTFDGNPGHPGPDRLWELAAEAEVTCFGAGAGFYEACRKAGLRPAADHDLNHLRALGSTGSPLHPEDFDWIYREVGDVWLFSTSGGTDVCTAFVGGAPTLPVRRGEIQAPALGVDVQAWDERGEPAAGVGELVVTQPMPSMPVGLWGDHDGSRYRESYFEMYPGVWRHGDWIEFRDSGGAVIHGRSDSTINRGGVRIGSAELYRVVLADPEVADAVVVDVPVHEDGSKMLLFLAMRDGAVLDEEARLRIAGALRRDCSPRHVPNEILAAPMIPRTLSGKVLETPIRRLFMGDAREEVASRDALAQPEALDWFADFAADWQG